MGTLQTQLQLSYIHNNYVGVSFAYIPSMNCFFLNTAYMYVFIAVESDVHCCSCWFCHYCLNNAREKRLRIK